MRIHILLGVLLAGLCLPLQAADLTDVETDVEELTADSEALAQHSRSSREQAILEREETARAKRLAYKAKGQAAAKQKKAAQELEISDREIVNLKAERKQWNKEKKAAEVEMVRLEKELKAKGIALDKARLQTQDLKASRDQLVAKNQRMNSDLELARNDLKLGEEKLAKVKEEFTLAKTQNDALLAQYKTEYKAMKSRTVVAEAEIRKRRTELQKLSEEVRIAEEEVEESGSRMRDAEVRLADLRERTKGKDTDLERRKLAANDTLRSRETKEALLKMDYTKARGEVSRSVASTKPNPVQVQLRPVLASARHTMTRDCRVFEKPDTSSKVIGVKKAGSKLTGAKGKAWVAIPLKANKKAYVPKGCF